MPWSAPQIQVLQDFTEVFIVHRRYQVGAWGVTIARYIIWILHIPALQTLVSIASHWIKLIIQYFRLTCNNQLLSWKTCHERTMLETARKWRDNIGQYLHFIVQYCAHFWNDGQFCALAKDADTAVASMDDISGRHQLNSKLLSIQMAKVEAIGLIIIHIDIYFCFVCTKGYIYSQSPSICAQYQMAVAASLIFLGLVMTATLINGIGWIHHHHSLHTSFRSWTHTQTDSTGIEIPGPWIQRVGGESCASQPRSKAGTHTGCKSCNDCLGTRLRPLASMTQSSTGSSLCLPSCCVQPHRALTRRSRTLKPSSLVLLAPLSLMTVVLTLSRTI